MSGAMSRFPGPTGQRAAAAGILTNRVNEWRERAGQEEL